MDKNSIIGLVLIFLLIIGYGWYSSPSKEQIEAARHKRDSIIAAQQEEQKQKAITEAQLRAQATNNTPQITNDTLISDTLKNDSIKAANYSQQFGSFAQAAQGTNEFYFLENELLKIKVSSKGGRIYSVELKKYTTYKNKNVVLFDGDSTKFDLKFYEQNQLNLYQINTSKLYFKNTPNSSKNCLTLRAYAGENKYIEFNYSLPNNSYLVKYTISFNGLTNIIAPNTNSIDLAFKLDVPSIEKGRDFEKSNTTVYFKHYQDEVDYLSEMKNDDKDIRTKLKWISFKQQFFSTFLIADSSFLEGLLKTEIITDNSEYLKTLSADLVLQFNNKENERIPLTFYFGPNHYQTLRKQKLDMERVIPLGWSFFLMHWINRFAVIPVFNFLSKFIDNYGIIILILTILLKLVTYPLTYKSYLASAKMRILKPQIDEVVNKISKDKPLERQQATMQFYRKAGVNPMGGCLPLLVQMPILIAMFRFFPSSIELRQKPFLWANDLSAYDSILDLPFSIPWYGDHVSLFCLLMTVSTLIYTYVNSQMTNMSSQQMPGMKFMTYFFPFMMLFWFNSYASGLSYYYLLANLLSFAQMWIMKRLVDDEKLLKQIEENKKKPIKKSSFQERLEKMAKQRGYKIK